MQWLEFTLAAFYTNLSTRLNLMHLPELIISTNDYGLLKKSIYYIARKIIVQRRWI